MQQLQGMQGSTNANCNSRNLPFTAYTRLIVKSDQIDTHHITIELLNEQYQCIKKKFQQINFKKKNGK